MGSPPPALIAGSVRDFLRRHAPFSSFDQGAFDFLIPRLKLAYYPKDALVVDRNAPTPLFHILQTGHVASRAAGLDVHPDRVLQPGECFPVGALSAGSPPSRSYVAVDDVFAFQLSGVDFQRLREISTAFSAFCGQALQVLAQQSLAELQRHYAQIAADQSSLTRPLGQLLRSAAVTCTRETTLRAALEQMRDAGVRSILVTNREQHPLGVFTLNDLRDRVVLLDRSLETPIAEVMTANPITLEVDASASDAMEAMAIGGFNQVIVVEHGKAVGTVFERDLFELQRVSLRQIFQAIRSARSIAALSHVADDIRNLARNLLAQGAGSESLTRTIAALNDALTRAVLEQIAQQHGIDDLCWCWLALGSEGRSEQTLATDQDNAIVFEGDAANSEGIRARLLGFAAAVNQALAALGYPLCKGGIMASNPSWCLSAMEWRERFTAWIAEPTPEALLHANIFFDFRPLDGKRALAEDLSAWLLARTAENRLFIRLMVSNALETDAPLGLIRAFELDTAPDGSASIDLKVRGTRIFVDAARSFALGLGLGETSTLARLRGAGQTLQIDPKHVAATVESFSFLQALRLRAQDRELRAGAAGAHTEGNRIDPAQLNEVDQRMLKEAFRQARKLQQRLKETFAVTA